MQRPRSTPTTATSSLYINEIRDITSFIHSETGYRNQQLFRRNSLKLLWNPSAWPTGWRRRGSCLDVEPHQILVCITSVPRFALAESTSRLLDCSSWLWMEMCGAPPRMHVCSAFELLATLRCEFLMELCTELQPFLERGAPLPVHNPGVTTLGYSQ